MNTLSLSNSPTETSDDDALSDFGSAAEILDCGAELLAHLGRSGLRFVPQPGALGVGQWTERLTAGFASPVEVVAGASVAGASVAGASVAEASVNDAAAPNPGLVARVPAMATPVSPSPTRFSPASPVVASEPYPGESLPVADRIAALDSLAASVMGCTNCKALASCRTQTVFGEGNPEARFVFVGEAPAAEDDQCGRPFMDEAGNLLTKMIEAMRLKREDVYLLHTVKCRPPGNRNPDQTEVGNCREYLAAQLQLLRPEYIICLGAVSSQALLRSKLSIGRLRQQFHEYHGSKVVVIYSPTYLRRNPDAKKAAWADLQMLMADAGL